jgi:hypothetical protein
MPTADADTCRHRHVATHALVLVHACMDIETKHACMLIHAIIGIRVRMKNLILSGRIHCDFCALVLLCFMSGVLGVLWVLCVCVRAFYALYVRVRFYARECVGSYMCLYVCA